MLIGGGARDLTVGENADGRLELFVIQDSTWGFNFSGAYPMVHLWQIAPNGGWSGAVPLGSQSAQSFRDVYNRPDENGRLSVVYVGADDKTYRISQQADGTWVEDQLNGSASAASLTQRTVVPVAPEVHDCFCTCHRQRQGSQILEILYSSIEPRPSERLSIASLYDTQSTVAELSCSRLGAISTNCFGVRQKFTWDVNGAPEFEEAEGNVMSCGDAPGDPASFHFQWK